VVGLAGQRRLLDGEVRSSGGKPGEARDRTSVLLAFAAQMEVGRLAHVELVEYALAHRCRHHRAAAVEDAQELLADTDFLAVGRQDLPDAAVNSGIDAGGGVGLEQLRLGVELSLEVGETRLALVELARCLDDLLTDLVEPLRRPRKVVVAVADEQPLARGLELNLVALQAQARCIDGKL
jgi:hypothetical protein